MIRRVFLAFVVLGLIASRLMADGFIVIHDFPHPIPGHFSFAPLEVTYHRVEVKIDGPVAITSIEQEFYNPNNRQLEGTYLFPLPDGAHIDKFSMEVNGRMTDAELLPAEKARSLYEEIVRKARDPALLEYAGRGAFKARIFPIEPHGRKPIKISYTQLIAADGGLSEYVYPLNTEKFSSRPLKEVSIRVTLQSQQPLKSVYCPSHTAEIKRTGSNGAVVGYEERQARPDTDFKLIWTQDPDPVGINFLSYRNGTDDGYFLLLASPGGRDADERAQPADIVFVLDTSGSMAGAKINQARKALIFCLANLNPEDRFEIVRFSTEAEGLFTELRSATPGNVEAATKFVNALKPMGGTAINDALGLATATFQKRSDAAGRPRTIIFLTDGQPTIGEIKEDSIVANVEKSNDGIRVFPFGIGSDINTHLLDRIAGGTRAFSQYVLPEEDIEVKVSGFYSKIQAPAMVDPKLEVTGDVRVSQLYPRQLPDLYKDQTLIVFGRYRGSGAAAATISGTINGKTRRFSGDVKFAENDRRHEFIPRLWATRRVGWLLDEIRMHGETSELKDEVVRLAREHGIVTPYTAYLILEDERRRDIPVALRTQRELGEDREALGRARGWYDSARKDSGALEKAGDRAVMNSTRTEELKQSWNLSQAQSSVALGKSSAAAEPSGSPSAGSSPMAGYRSSVNYAQQARVIKGRAFYQNGSIWTDATAQSRANLEKNLKQRQIQFNSDEYFALVKAHPEAAAWLSLGDQLDVVLGDTLYNIR